LPLQTGLSADANFAERLLLPLETIYYSILISSDTHNKVVSGEDSNPFPGQNYGQILGRLWYINALFTPLKACGLVHVLLGGKWSKPMPLPIYLGGKGRPMTIK
jgi:hypothetical protein